MNRQIKFFLYGFLVLPLLHLVGVVEEDNSSASKPTNDTSHSRLGLGTKTALADTPGPYGQSGYYTQSFYYTQSLYSGDDSDDSSYSPPAPSPPTPSGCSTCSCVNGATFVDNNNGTFSRIDSSGNYTGNVSESYVESACSCDAGSAGLAYGQSSYYAQPGYTGGYTSGYDSGGGGTSGYSGGTSGYGGGTSGYGGGTSGYGGGTSGYSSCACGTPTSGYSY